MAIEAWHFIPKDKRMRYGDGTVITAGYTYYFDGEPEMCRQGLHASVKATDALNYAPGPIICRVRLGGTIIEGDDKCVATEREVLWMADATDTLRAYARWCALEVAHLWDMPQGVRQYLETGDESLRAAAGDAAGDAAWAAAWAAAGAAAGAARAAARAAAWAARAAARAAAKADQEEKLAEMLFSLEN